MPIFSEIKYWKIVYILLFIAFLLTFVELLDLRNDFNIEKLRVAIQHNSINGFFLFVSLFVLGNFIQIPGLIFLAAAVITLGKTYGGLVTYCAAISSCTISFIVIRSIGGDMLRRLKYQWTEKTFQKLDNQPISSVFILRSIFQTQPLLNYGFALSGISFKNHLIGTIFALPLPIILYCVFFDELAKYFKLIP